MTATIPESVSSARMPRQVGRPGVDEQAVGLLRKLARLPEQAPQRAQLRCRAPVQGDRGRRKLKRTMRVMQSSGKGSGRGPRPRSPSHSPAARAL